jgi:uncharacterized protein YycO
MKGMRLLGSAVSVVGMALMFAVPAHAADVPPLERLVELNPGMSVAEMRAELEEAAAESGVTYDEILAQALAEAEANMATGDDRGPLSSGGGGDRRKVVIGKADRVGDLFHSWAKTAGVTHNHTGIYYTTGTIVEAPGGDNKSWSRDATSHRVYATAYKLKVDTSQANRNKAGKYAYNNLRGKSYQKSFWRNKNGDTSKLNCSELVWLAYKKAVNIDLDGDGGLGVYPNDIKKSGKTSVYKTLN